LSTTAFSRERPAVPKRSILLSFGYAICGDTSAPGSPAEQTGDVMDTGAMPWNEVSVFDERIEFAREYACGLETMAELCRRYGINRKTGYKWAGRFLLEGARGMADRSSRPKSNSRAVDDEVVEFLLSVRRVHKSWGPKKIRAKAMEWYPDVAFPAASTIGEVLKRHGITKPRRRRNGAPPRTQPFSEYTAPNSVWCADYKGQFRVRGKYCYPLTIMDGFSRYLLRCDALIATTFELAKPMFQAAFREYGIPAVIRTDNGAPFASRAAGGLGRLSVWWIKLGIRPERIEPGKPQQNGRHERMHRTLKQEAASPPEPSFTRQQRAFDRFRGIYNYERPHEALGQIPPARVYQPSERRFPKELRDPVYPRNYEQRRVQHNGIIRWRGQRLFVSSSLAGELVGLREQNKTMASGGSTSDLSASAYSTRDASPGGLSVLTASEPSSK